MRKVFTGFVGLLMLAVVVQFFLAASGAFDTGAKDEAFAPHRALGYLILLLTVILIVFAAVLRMPGRIIGLCGLLAGLTLLQPIIADVADAFGGSGDTSTTAGKVVFGLHAVNALVIFSVVRTILGKARELTAEPAAAAPAEPLAERSAADSGRSGS